MQDYKENSRRAFDRQAPNYDTASFGSHARSLYPILLSQLAQLPRRRVLDVGCGTGELLRMVGERFPETTRTGLDLSAEMLSVARHKLGEGVELVQGDAERLPFADRAFDVVLCCDSFHHYPNPRAVLAQFARVLQPRPGGGAGGDQPAAPPVPGGGCAHLQRQGAGGAAFRRLPRGGVPPGWPHRPGGLGGKIAGILDKNGENACKFHNCAAKGDVIHFFYSKS